MGGTQYFGSLDRLDPRPMAECFLPGGGWPIPKVGERVAIKINSLGPGIVVGYFTECGFLGVQVRLDRPPAWRRKQCADSEPALVFGAEMESVVSGGA
jgi:hypothetical protein